MKNTFLTLFILFFFAGCSDQKLTHQETVTKYFNARDASDFKELKKVINDSITITAGDYVMQYDQNSFYEQFKWDSVFRPSYKIVESKEKNNQMIVTVAQDNVRNKFLKNNPLVCQFKISFTSGKISRLEELECISTDWNIWQKERDSLVSWINKNHPELDGFINDMTMSGSIDYLKAIELYTNDKIAL